MLAFRGRLDHQIRQRDGDQNAVDGAARAVFFQQTEKALPRRRIRLTVTVLGGVAPGGIHQHRFVGKPPVTVTRTTDAAHRVASEAFRQGKIQTGVEQGGCLAGTRGTDDDVPRQFVKKLIAERTFDAALLEHRDSRLEVLLESGDFLTPGGLGGLLGFHQVLGHGAVGALGAIMPDELDAAPDSAHHNDQYQAGCRRGQRPGAAPVYPRPQKPYDHGHGDHPYDGREPLLPL